MPGVPQDPSQVWWFCRRTPRTQGMVVLMVKGYFRERIRCKISMGQSPLLVESQDMGNSSNEMWPHVLRKLIRDSVPAFLLGGDHIGTLCPACTKNLGSRKYAGVRGRPRCTNGLGPVSHPCHVEEVSDQCRGLFTIQVPRHHPRATLVSGPF